MVPNTADGNKVPAKDAAIVLTLFDVLLALLECGAGERALWATICVEGSRRVLICHIEMGC